MPISHVLTLRGSMELGVVGPHLWISMCSVQQHCCCNRENSLCVYFSPTWGRHTGGETMLLRSKVLKEKLSWGRAPVLKYTWYKTRQRLKNRIQLSACL